MRPHRVAVIGSGWSGAAAARILADNGVAVEVFEAKTVLGGHSRVERAHGVVFEPNGPHVFHTAHSRVAQFVKRFGMFRRFSHAPLTRLDIDGVSSYLNWPLQLEEVRKLPMWPRIHRELEKRPASPRTDNLETYCISMIGETLYRLFVYSYTRKRWGLEASQLSAEIARGRVALRVDGRRRLFADPWEFFPAEGVNDVIEAVLDSIPVHFNTTVHLANLSDELYRDFDHVICTAALDAFTGQENTLKWRGIEMRPRYYQTKALHGTVTRAYCINEPSAGVPYTRTVETKHATGQAILGSVVCEEYARADARHYPIHTTEGLHEARNELLKQLILSESPVPVSFCGCLANYRHIDQDQAILQGMLCAERLLKED